MNAQGCLLCFQIQGQDEHHLTIKVRSNIFHFQCLYSPPFTLLDFRSLVASGSILVLVNIEWCQVRLFCCSYTTVKHSLRAVDVRFYMGKLCFVLTEGKYFCCSKSFFHSSKILCIVSCY